MAAFALLYTNNSPSETSVVDRMQKQPFQRQIHKFNPCNDATNTTKVTGYFCYHPFAQRSTTKACGSKISSIQRSKGEVAEVLSLLWDKKSI